MLFRIVSSIKKIKKILKNTSIALIKKNNNNSNPCALFNKYIIKINKTNNIMIKPNLLEIKPEFSKLFIYKVNIN